jgi:hypothetical protein
MGQAFPNLAEYGRHMLVRYQRWKSEVSYLKTSESNISLRSILWFRFGVSNGHGCCPLLQVIYDLCYKEARSNF